MTERLKIAIIGGGASGLISGYLLNEKHDITLYEKDSILGGNVRTLNKNVLDTNLPKNIAIENGVLGFSQNYYPKFHKLLHHLGTPYHSYKPSISLFANEQFYPAKNTSYLNIKSFSELISNSNFRKELQHLVESQKEFKKKLNESNPYNQNFSDYSTLKGLYKNYLQTLFMLSFSTPLEKVHQLPQTLLNPYLKSLPNSTWSFVKGGVYSYLETLLSKSNMRLICNAKNLQISRSANNIKIKYRGEEHLYDSVIIATTPGSVKKLLTDMTTIENDIFSDMNDQTFKTIAHSDVSFYGRFKKAKKTPMDLFLNYNQIKKGYNTYQNNVYKLPSNVPYSFAYNMDNQILKDTIINETNHTVPLYAKNHDLKIKQIQSINGQNRTFFVGAYLENGLHEGAVASAMQIAQMLGGIILE